MARRKKKLSPLRETLHFLILGLMLVVSLLAIRMTNHRVPQQFMIAVISAVGYVIWGYWHHQQRGDLHKQVIIEYTIFALFYIAIVVSLLLAI